MRYWIAVSLCLLFFPGFVLYLNREDGLSEGDKLGLVVSAVPACVGAVLGLVLLRLYQKVRVDVAGTAFLTEQLGIGLCICSTMFALGSLVTFTGVFFIAGLGLLTIPAGLLAGLSAELVRANQP